MTVRQLYGWSFFAVASFAAWAFCMFSPPQTWKVFQKPPAAKKKAAPANITPFEGDGYTEVSAWLRKNLDDPEFERVTWWRMRSLADEKKRVAAALDEQRKKLIANLKSAEDDLDEAERRIAKDPSDFAARSARDTARQNCTMWRSLIETDRMTIVRESPDYVCRITYRTRNKFGAKELRDTTFGVFRGKIKPLAETDALSLKELFPD